MNEQKRDMSPQQFGDWLQEKAGGGIRMVKERIECVVPIDHIEPGSFLALYGERSRKGLQIIELTGYFASEKAAWEALQNGADAYSPVPLSEWLEQQYITESKVQVEKLKI